MAEAVGDMASEAMALPPEGDMSEINLPVGEGGGALSPLSGAYLLVVLSEPMSESHKKSMVQKLRQGKKKREKRKKKGKGPLVSLELISALILHDGTFGTFAFTI